MQTAKMGDRVAVQYIGTLDNGPIFDSRDVKTGWKSLWGPGRF